MFTLDKMWHVGHRDTRYKLFDVHIQNIIDKSRESHTNKKVGSLNMEV